MFSAKYFIAAATLIVLVNGAPPPPGSDHMCQGSTLKISDDLIKARDTCIAKMSPGSTFETLKDTKEAPKNASCMTVCFMQEAGVMSADYKFDTNKLAALGKNVGVPDKAVTSIVEAVNDCIKEHGASIAVKDGKCDGMEPVLKCAGMAFNKICDASPAA